MADVKPRTYTSPLRRRQAAANRAAILAAARDLFLAQGYAATSIDQIAAAAGVSKPTVFYAVGNKVELLKVVRDVAMAGDDDPVPVAERPSMQAVIDSPDLATAIAAAAAHMTAIDSRWAGINDVLHEAAGSDPALRALWDASEDQRLAGARLFADILASKGPLSVSRDRAVDILWGVIMLGEPYLHLVTGRGWTEEAFQQWRADTITSQLFANAAPTR
jgi:AcrR family transcriptional regulator